MKDLKDFLTERRIEELRASIAANEFPGITFDQAMQFALTDGIVPADDLPVSSLLALEDWLRGTATRIGGE